ncbi:MAG TPA: universal stress protein [Caulobacteraceae bacterium]|nr:universal stress protein [Caulobacteraceae bacterium]
MPIKDIALFLRADAPHDDAIALTALLAGREGAAVEGICLSAEPILPFADAYAIGEAAALAVLEQRDRSIAAQLAPIERAFRKAMAAAGAPATWRPAAPDEAVDATVLRARFADLAVVRRPEPHHPAQAALADELVFSSGTPCLIAPDRPAARGFDNVILAWDASANAKRALDAAIGFLETATAVEILLVDEHGPRAEDEWSNALLSHLGRHGVHAALRHDQRRGRPVGEVILDGCDRFRADLLVMGAYGHGRGAETVFGGATRDVLSNALVPVLMAH